MRWTALLGLLAGLALTAVLIGHFGASAVGEALRAAGWAGLFVIAAGHLVVTVLLGIAWWVIAGGRFGGGTAWVYVWGRMLRDAGSEILPLSQLGGYVLGVRAVVLHGVGGTVAAASTIVDVTLELCAQIAYTALGLFLLFSLRPASALIPPALIGLAIAVLVVSIFITVQRRGTGLINRLTTHLARAWLLSLAAGAEAAWMEIRETYRHSDRVLCSFLLHLTAWVAVAVQAWLALHMMGLTLGLAPVLAMESLLYAIRSVAFAVPNALGVQEGAYVMLGTLLGVPPDIALGLSLLKRGRDLLIGAPALLAWQFFESRRFWAG